MYNTLTMVTGFSKPHGELRNLKKKQVLHVKQKKNFITNKTFISVNFQTFKLLWTVEIFYELHSFYN